MPAVRPFRFRTASDAGFRRLRCQVVRLCLPLRERRARAEDRIFASALAGTPNRPELPLLRPCRQPGPTLPAPTRPTCPFPKTAPNWRECRWIPVRSVKRATQPRHRRNIPPGGAHGWGPDPESEREQARKGPFPVRLCPRRLAYLRLQHPYLRTVTQHWKGRQGKGAHAFVRIEHSDETAANLGNFLSQHGAADVGF